MSRRLFIFSVVLLALFGCENDFDRCFKQENRDELLTFFDDNRFKCQSHKDGPENDGFENGDILQGSSELLLLCPKIFDVKYASSKPNLTTKEQKEKASELAIAKCNEKGSSE